MEISKGHDTIQTRKIRVRKEDSAYVYNILESYEGIASYSTLPHLSGDAHRDLELNVPWAFEAEVSELLRELGELIYDLEASSSQSKK